MYRSGVHTDVPLQGASVCVHSLLYVRWAAVAAGPPYCWSEPWSDEQTSPSLNTDITHS